jgi:hypothetical protein
MASPGELVRTFSELFGLAEPTIVLHDRNLAVAGLRSKSGRGNSAARMTARDAAHLLVAVLGSTHVKDSAETVRRYWKASFRKNASSGYDESTITALRDLPRDHSFVDAVEALFAAAADGSLERAMYNSIGEFGFPPMIEITAQTPGELGDILIQGGDTSGHGRYGLPDALEYYQKSSLTMEDVDLFNEKFKDHFPVSDLLQYRKVSAKTIVGIGRLLRSGEREFI